MQSVTVIIDGQVEEGYTFHVESGESVQDTVQRYTNERGQAYWHDKQRMLARDLIAKVEANPDAYAAAINEIAVSLTPPPLEEGQNLRSII